MKNLVLIGFLLFISSIFGQVNPQLIIDTKGHSAPVSNLIFLENGNALLSVSQDKTIRIWNVETQQLKRTLRINIGQNFIGAIYSADYNAKNDVLAIGGYLSSPSQNTELGKIILIKISTGDVIDELKFHKSTINALKFSPDGNFLVSGDSEGKIALWTVSGTNLKLKNSVDGHMGGVNAIDVSNKNIISGGEDGMVKLWKIAANGLTTSETANNHKGKINTVAASADGNYFASAGEDKLLILYNLNFEVKEKNPDLDLATIAFSADGKKLICGGDNPNTVKVFTTPDLNMLSQFTKHSSLVSSTAIIGDKVASAGGDNFDIYVWDINSPAISDHLVGKGSPKLTVGVDSKTNIAYSEKSLVEEGSLNQSKLEKGFNVSDFSIITRIANYDYTREIIKFSSFELKKITDNQLQIDEKNMIEIPEKNDIIRSYSYTKDGNIILASDFSLESYDAKGDYLKTYDGHNGSVWSVVVSEDNKFLISCGDDQTIRFWNLEDKGEFESAWDYYAGTSWRTYFKNKNLTTLAQKPGKAAWFDLIQKIKTNGDKDITEMQEDIANIKCSVKPALSLFISSDNEWVIWTNEGYYTASAGGEKFIGWQINSTDNKLAQFFPASAFRAQFFKPEIIKNIFTDPTYKPTVVQVNVTQENKTEPRTVVAPNILNTLPPKIEFIYPLEYKTTVSQKQVKIKVKIKSDKKITNVKILVNGAKASSEKDKKEENNAVVFRGGKEKINDSTYVFDISLNDEENNIMIFAANENGNSVSDEKIIELKKSKDAGNATDFIIKPNLYMISIGVSKFIDPSNNLDFADDDANEMAAIFTEQKGLLYNDVKVKLLTDSQATRLNILDAFGWLEKSVTNKDIAIIFIATHGFNQKDKFYILPHDGNFESYRGTCVDWSDFSEILKNLPCKTVMFLDACHSGQLGKNLYSTRGAADNNTEALRELASDESGVVILSASTGAEKSLESKAWGHGAFTYSVINAVRKKEGDIKKDNIIYLTELEYTIAEKVKELTEGQQHPTTQKPSSISTLPLFQLKK